MGKESIKVYIGRTARVPLMMFMYPEYAHSALVGEKKRIFKCVYRVPKRRVLLPLFC